VLILLFFGFLMTLSSGAMGASAIINTGKKWGKSAVNLAGKTTKSNIGRATRDVLMSEKAGKLTDSMVKSERKGLGGWAERGIGLQLGKARLGAAAQVSAFMNDKTLQGFIAQDNIDAAVAYAKRYDPLNPNNDIKQIAAAAAIGDQKKDIGLVTARKADPMFTRNAIDKASNAGLREFVKKIVGDAPSEADDDTVVKSYLYNDDLIKKEETNLGSILQEFLAIAKMSDDELKKPERKAEQRLIERLEERLGSDWRNKLRKAGNIKNIIGMRDSEVADTTKGVFGAVTGEWSLRKVVKGLDLDGTAKLSSESYKDAWIQNLYARMKNVSHFDKLNEVLAPDDYTGIKEGVGRIGSERLMDQNWTLAQSMVSGVKEYLFDGLTYQRDWTEPLRNKNGGLVKDKKTGNLIMIQHKTGERIENLQALRSYRGFISSGGGTTMTPGPGPAPTPGGPAPTLRRTPRPGGSTTSPLPAGTIPFGSNIPGSQGENVAARETDRIQKDIERRDKEARRADKERAEQKTATAAAEAMAASSPYKVGERVTVQGGKTGIVDRIPASGFVEVKYDDGTKSAWPIRNVSGTTKNPNSPPPAPAAGGGGTTLSSIPQGAPPVWFINNLPSVPLQDLGKGPQIGYAGGKILKHEGGAGENLEAHPIPGGMTYRTMIPPGMAGTPKKIEVDSGGKWMPLNNGQPAIFDKKSLVRIDGTEYRVSKDYTLIKSQPKT
ncbi:MAG: hypothetical protein Q8N56_02330, partial [bacterium]|nr:hypothetical protein [bacterium]